MEMSETIGALSAALAKAQAEIGKALKDSTNPAFKSKYADLASVWDAWQAVGPANGLAIVQLPGCFIQGQASLTTILSHTSGEFMRETMTLPVSKQDAQGVGSATTYLRRYALAAFVGIAPDDDDGNLAVQASTAPMKAAFPEGPHRNKTALDTAITAFCGHIAALQTPDDVETAIDDAKPTLSQYRRHYGPQSEHWEAIAKQLADSRARVLSREGLPNDNGPVPLKPQHTWSPEATKLVSEIERRETELALTTWTKNSKAQLDALEAVELQYVRGQYADRLSAVRAMALATAG